MAEYEDRQEISDVLIRFATGIDRRDVDAWIMSQDNASGINAIGFYDDDLVRTADGWRIERRTFTQVRLSVSSP